MVGGGRRCNRARGAPAQGALQVGQQCGVGTGQRFLPADQNVVMAGLGEARHQFARRGTKAPPGAVALDRAAYPLAHGNSEPRVGRAIDVNDFGAAGADLEDQARSCDFAARSRYAEILRAPAQPPDPERTAQAESRLRPFARRLAITLRPPAVCIRERKPWRRLRTSALG